MPSLRPGLRRLLILLVVVAVVLAGLDLAARVVAQDEVASRARSATGASSASATVEGFPFLARLLLQGKVEGLRVHLTGVPAGNLVLGNVDVHLTGTAVDRGALFSTRQVRVTGIAAGTAAATVTAAELSAALGAPVLISGGGQVVAEVAGRRVPASLTIVDGHRLVVVAEGRTLLSEDLATSPLMPDCNLALVVSAGRMSASCHVAPVPERVVQSIAGR